MKNQVTSIEQSKRLIEMGVPAEKASMHWFQELEYKPKLNAWEPTNNCFLMFPRLENPIDYKAIYPAFTVADMLGLINPTSFAPNTLAPTLEKRGDNDWEFEFGQILEDEDFGYGRDKSLVDLLVGRIEWILSKGYTLEV